MKTFAQSEVEEAIDHAARGGQALHLHRICGAGAPLCFQRAVKRGEHIAHLFDQDLQRLRFTARRLGVRVVVVEYQGTPRQHIDLCGTPLRRAVREANGED